MVLFKKFNAFSLLESLLCVLAFIAFRRWRFYFKVNCHYNYDDLIAGTVGEHDAVNSYVIASVSIEFRSLSMNDYQLNRCNDTHFLLFKEEDNFSIFATFYATLVPVTLFLIAASKLLHYLVSKIDWNPNLSYIFELGMNAGLIVLWLANAMCLANIVHHIIGITGDVDSLIKGMDICSGLACDWSHHALVLALQSSLIMNIMLVALLVTHSITIWPMLGATPRKGKNNIMQTF